MKRFCILMLLLPAVSFSLHAQSLYEDAQRLVRSRDTLMMPAGTYGAAHKRAYAEIMAILQHYDGSYRDSALTGTKLLKTPFKYADNELLWEWLPIDSLGKSGPLLADPEFAQFYRSSTDSIQSNPHRQRMLKLMVGPHAHSPAEYLSVSRTLQEYSVPPVQSQVYLKAAAQESNRNLDDGLLNTDDLIEGLFRFVVERAQQEIAISFMDRFLEDEVPPVKLLFPTVFDEVKTIGFNYSHSYLERIRAGFYQDLQLLSVRLPTVLLKEERFEPLQRNPIVYNLLTVYSIIGLSQNDLPTGEVMAVTHRNLFENYLQNQKRRNLTIALNGKGGTDYVLLSDMADSAYTRIKAIYIALNQAEEQLELELSRLQSRKRQSGIDQAEPAFDQLFDEGYQLSSLLGEDQAYPLNFLPDLLRGELNSEHIMGIRTVEGYDRYFKKTYTENQLRAAGLEIARSLYGGNWYDGSSLTDLLEAWVEDLALYRRELTDYQYELFPEDQPQYNFDNLERSRRILQETIQKVKADWGEELSRQQALAFDLLAAIMGDTVYYSREDIEDEQMLLQLERPGENVSLSEIIDLRWKQIEAVEERLVSLNAELLKKTNQEETEDSILSRYFESKIQPAPYQGIRANIKLLEQQLQRMRQQIEEVDNNYAGLENQLLSNAEPMLFLTEALGQMMYCLAAPGEQQQWLSRQQLDTVLADDQLRSAFMGLLYQRMRSIRQFRQLSPQGLAQLVQMTVADLPRLAPAENALLALPDSLAFQRKASFIVNTLSRLVETPLLVDPVYPDSIRTLATQFPILEHSPKIAGEVTNFVHHINNKSHRQAMGSLLRLFAEVNTIVATTQNGEEELNKTIRFLNKYGFFVAGLVDARSGPEVSSLLNNVSDPPGSSRLKRRTPWSITLNAYAGASFGYETWEDDQMGIEESFWNVAPTLPLGVSFNFLTGPGQPSVYDEDGVRVQKAKRPGSFSVFAGIIDLGSLLKFSLEEQTLGNTDLTFKNMFKPSLQFMYNFPRSPFYMGVGAQFGPHFRDINDEQEPLRSTRAFFSVGVDIPVKTLYLR